MVAIPKAKRVIRPQPGPQTAFLSSPADIVIYGGAAGVEFDTSILYSGRWVQNINTRGDHGDQDAAIPI